MTLDTGKVALALTGSNTACVLTGYSGANALSGPDKLALDQTGFKAFAASSAISAEAFRAGLGGLRGGFSCVLRRRAPFRFLAGRAIQPFKGWVLAEAAAVIGETPVQAPRFGTRHVVCAIDPRNRTPYVKIRPGV